MLNIESVRAGEYSEYEDSIVFDIDWFDNKFDNTINAKEFNGKEITADSLREGLCIEIFAECVEYTVRNPYNVFFQMQDSVCVSIYGYDWYGKNMKNVRLELVIPIFQEYLCKRLMACETMDKATDILGIIETLAYYQCFFVEKDKPAQLSVDNYNALVDAITQMQLGENSFMDFALQYGKIIKPEFNPLLRLMNADTAPIQLASKVSLFLRVLWRSLFDSSAKTESEYVLKLWSEVETEFKLCKDEYPNFISLNAYIVYDSEVPIAVTIDDCRDDEYKWDTRKDREIVFSYYYSYTESDPPCRDKTVMVTYFKCADGTYECERFETCGNIVQLRPASSDWVREQWEMYMKGYGKFNSRRETLVALREELLDEEK